VRFDVQGTYRPLERRIEDQLLRIGKEAVSNALRHAGANQIDVTLFYNADAVRLSVIDDGKGFDPETVQVHREGHFGLQGMKERASEIQAAFEIQSQTGQGTRVCVELHI
jgi:signal transduction histidine kinase